MKNNLFNILLLSLFAASCGNPTEPATEVPKTETEVKADAPAMPDSATMMKNWEGYMTPGPMHTMMASWDGTWEGQSSMWEGPDKPRLNYTITTTNKMIMGGRYQQSTNTGVMMEMPFEGLSNTGYDNQKKVFKTTWIDNFGTGIMVLEGPWDEATKTMNLKGTMVDPGMASSEETPVRQEYKVVDADNHEMRMYTDYPGMGEVMMMEIKWKRKK